MGVEGRSQVDFRAKLTGWLWATALRLLCRSWKKRYEGFKSIDQKRRQGRKMMLCFWHGKYLPIFALCRWLWIEQRRGISLRVYEPLRSWPGYLRNLPQFWLGLHPDSRPRAKTLVWPNEKRTRFPYLRCHCR